jgi:Ca-activated chloride channel family protein
VWRAGGDPRAPQAAPIGGFPDGAPHAGGPNPFLAPDDQEYADYGVNPPVDPRHDRVSTFAVDVDTGSYAMARRRLREGWMPDPVSVRAEEFLNSFDYGYRAPKKDDKIPFAVHLAAAPSPFAGGHHLLRVAVQGRRVSAAERKPVHLVYLVDTSGSMQAEDRLGLAKKSLKILTGSLKQGDTVALCTYAGSVREVLPPTGVEARARILGAIDDLSASGSTAMASGIDLAYKLAEQSRMPGEVNRVIVLSDGDANVGATSHEEILKEIRGYKAKGITLSTVGFGQGNYKDAMMEQLADQGDGNYAYIDSEKQARRVFGQHAGGMLEVIARDVKIQVEFDPKVVRQYRLIGYENRDVADKDFRNDKVDGGEIGAGHSVTALYDVVLRTTSASPVTVRLRHKAPLGADVAQENAFEMPVAAIAPRFESAPVDLRFAASVAGFAEILRKSAYAEGWRLGDVERAARAAADDSEEQRELIELIETARRLSAPAVFASR